MNVCLAVFYEKYNNEWVYFVIVMLLLVLFWEVYEKNFVIVGKDKRKKNIFKFKVFWYLFLGNLSFEGVFCFVGFWFDVEVR